MRWYKNAELMDAQGLDWRSVLIETWTNEEAALPRNPEDIFLEVYNEPEIATEHDKIEAFYSSIGK